MTIKPEEAWGADLDAVAALAELKPLPKKEKAHVEYSDPIETVDPDKDTQPDA